MPVDVEVVKSAFDDFERENFVDSREKLVGQVKAAKNDWLKNKLNLKNDVYVPAAIVTEPKKEEFKPEEDVTKVEEPKKPRKSILRKPKE
jgi:hypothetical protein